MSQFFSEFRFACRMLLRRPGFALAAVLTLAFGIGANTAIFSVVNAALLRPLPFREPAKLVWAWSILPDHADWPFNMAEFLEYQKRNRTLEDLTAYTNFGANLTGHGDAERLQGLRISANVFQMLGTQAALGRTLMPEDDRPGHSRVVVLSDALWIRRFGADPHVISQNIALNGSNYTILGVLPKGFLLPAPRGVDFVIPLAPDEDPGRNQRAAGTYLNLIGRVKPGVSVAAAQADLSSVTRQLREQYPNDFGRRDRVRLETLPHRLAGNYSLSLWVLLGAVALVLLIACANLANLLMARAAARRKEIAIRRALGAGGAGIVRLLLAESVTLALAGGAAGTLAAMWALPALRHYAPSDLPRLTEVTIDPTVLGFALAASLLTGILFGLLPAWQSARSINLDALKDGGKGDAEAGLRGRFRGLLVSGEVAVALMLLLSAGLFVRSFSRLTSVAPGFESDHSLVVRLSLPRPKYATAEALARFYDQMLPRIQNLPGVRQVGLVSIFPLSGPMASADFTIVGHPPGKRENVPEAQYRMASPGYFSSMGIVIKQGRGFSETDTANATAVVAVSETLAKKFFPGANPIGAEMLLEDNGGASRKVEIVGVVSDVRQTTLDSAPTFDIYVPIRQAQKAAAPFLANNQFWVVKTVGDPLALAEVFRRELRSVDADIPTFNVRTGDQYLDGAISQRRFTMSLVTAFAIAGLLLAAGGIYAVVSYTVSLRTREIAIRMALGARRADILRLVVGQGMTLVGAGLAAGLVATLIVTRLLASLLFGVGATDPMTFTAVPVLLAAAALTACLAPAMRAARVLPMMALRNE